MAFAVVLGLLSGGFGEEGSAIWALAWGKVTLIDLYVGIVFFGLWVSVRESRPPVVGIWWIALIVLGNLAAALYLVLVSFRSSTLHEVLTGERSRPLGTGVPEPGGHVHDR